MKHGSITSIQNSKNSIDWKHPGSLPSKKFKKMQSSGKRMASFFWDSHDWLSWARSYHKRYVYADELRRLRQQIARKRRGKLTRGVLLLHDNALAHTFQVAMAAATDCGFEILPHPPNSSNLAPLTSSCFWNWQPSFLVDVFEAMKMSWRRSIRSLRTKIESSILEG
jgi:hypothetical protein